MLTSKKRIKVLIVDGGRWWGGAEACLLGMVRGFDRARVDVEICIDYPMAHHERYRAAGARVVGRFAHQRWWMHESLKKRIKGLDFFDCTIAAARLHFLARQRRADIVHVNLLRNRSHDIVAARLAGKRVIGHVRHLTTQIPMGRKVLDRCDAVICVSDAVRRGLAQTGTTTELVTVYDGVDPQEFAAAPARSAARRCLGLSETDLVLAYPAVLEPRKGHEVAIRALATLEHLDDLFLVIAGGEPASFGGACGRRLNHLAAQLGVAQRVRFLGHLDDVATLYAAADVVLALAGDGEAYGRVAVEAAQAERSTIATGLGATTEIVVDGETGILVAPGDHVGVAAAIARLHADRQLRERLGRQARGRAVERFGYGRGVAAIEDLYGRVLGRARRPRARGRFLGAG